MADVVTSNAIDGKTLGRRYYMSLPFVGTVLGTSLGVCSCYSAYLLPVGILSYINADIGKKGPWLVSQLQPKLR